MKKAIVESVNGTKVRVRIPELHKINGAVGATPTSEIPFAAVCTQPGYTPNLQPGDVVLVDFEYNEYGTPIVVGILFTDRQTKPVSDLSLGSLKVRVNSELPEDTKIGKVTAKSIKNLENSSENIQLALDNIRKTFTDLTDKIIDRLNNLTDRITEIERKMQ